MSKPRILMVLILLFGLLGSHAVCVIANDEYWPFSNYPMYSKRYWESWTDVYLVGTLRDDPTQEVPVSYFDFARPISVKVSLQHMANAMEDDPGKADELREAMLGLGQIYLEKYAGNEEDHPAIRTLRLYTVTWQIIEEKEHRKAQKVSEELSMEVDLAWDENVATEGGA